MAAQGSVPLPWGDGWDWRPTPQVRPAEERMELLAEELPWLRDQQDVAFYGDVQGIPVEPYGPVEGKRALVVAREALSLALAERIMANRPWARRMFASGAHIPRQGLPKALAGEELAAPCLIVLIPHPVGVLQATGKQAQLFHADLVASLRRQFHNFLGRLHGLQEVLRFCAEAGPGGEEIEVIRSHGD